MAATSDKPRLPRYYLFLGCAIEDCDDPTHTHRRGWESMAAVAHSLDDMRAGLRQMKSTGPWWWQVVDIATREIVMSSEDLSQEKH